MSDRMKHLARDFGSDQLSSWCGKSEAEDRDLVIVGRLSEAMCLACLHSVEAYGGQASARVAEIRGSRQGTKVMEPVEEIELTSPEDCVGHRDEDPIPYLAYDGSKVRYYIRIRPASGLSKDVRDIEVDRDAYRDVIATLQLTLRNQVVDAFGQLSKEVWERLTAWGNRDDE